MNQVNWKVENGVFIGLILCDKKSDLDLKDLGIKVDVEEHWLPCCIDLREIMTLRVRGYEEDALLTVLEGKGPDPDKYTVDAPMHALQEHFVKSRA
jgi:hypothetical protein